MQIFSFRINNVVVVVVLQIGKTLNVSLDGRSEKGYNHGGHDKMN